MTDRDSRGVLATDDAARGMGRRGFLRTAGGLLVSGGLLAACNSEGPQSAQPLLDFAERKNELLERKLFRHRSMASAPDGMRAAGDAFPGYHIADEIPTWDSEVNGAWALTVGGLVRTPLTITLDALMVLPRVTQRVPHFCVEGWTAVAEFTGVRLRELATLAGAHPDAGYVDFTSFDEGYHESWDRDSAEHDQTIIVYAKDGRLLSPKYGAPVRVHSPVKLGYKNTKYLTSVLFMAERNGGYWSDKGYEWYGGT